MDLVQANLHSQGLLRVVVLMQVSVDDASSIPSDRLMAWLPDSRAEASLHPPVCMRCYLNMQSGLAEPHLLPIRQVFGEKLRWVACDADCSSTALRSWTVYRYISIPDMYGDKIHAYTRHTCLTYIVLGTHYTLLMGRKVLYKRLYLSFGLASSLTLFKSTAAS